MENDNFKKLSPQIQILIMAGGSGTRFWPRSTKNKPKQLLALWDDKTLIEHTVERFLKFLEPTQIWIVTTEALTKATQDCLGEVSKKINWISEPLGKNTAPCILWGTLEIQKKNQDSVVAVMAADHFIGDLASFYRSLCSAVELANKPGVLVTIGISPSRPETGYGYIELEEKPASGSHKSIEPLLVKHFVEKPDLKTASQYISSGRYFWNAGMFVFNVESGIGAFQKAMPSLLNKFTKDINNIRQEYLSLNPDEATSFDFGVMEKARFNKIDVFVVPTDCQWNDVGSFAALEEIECAEVGQVITHDSASNVVQTDKGIVSLLGVSDLIVVRQGDVVLVASKSRAQDIKKLLEKVSKIRPDLV